MNKKLVLALLAISIPALADQGGFVNSGGSLGGGTPVTNPSGTLTIVGSTLTFVTTDGSTTINATFSTSSTVESCSGGGRGGHITCTFTFTGSFNGTLTVNGATQAIIGSTSQLYGTDGVVITGSTGYNSAYTPFYFSNTGQILRSDDLNGTNLISYGTQGSGVGQFYGAYGIALDSLGRIYVADTYNGRVVRIDDMNGTNWTAFGTYGSGAGQFNDPQGVSIDPAGRIYVMDTGNNRLVRIDDMNGTNWTTFTGLGSGVGQFAQYVAPVVFDASGRLYFADTGNNRIVRMDDLTGANWTTLTQSPVINSYIYLLQSPLGVAVDAAGKIYVVEGGPPQPEVVRVDDMTGTNWTSIYLGSSSTPHSIAVDSSGMVLVGGGGAQTVDNMAAVQLSSSALTEFYGPYYVFGATLVPVPSPRPSAIRFSPPTLSFSQNVGTTSAPQTLTISNFGGSTLTIGSVFSTSGFSETNNCSTLLPGSNCAVNVTFTPSAAGAVSGQLNVTDDSGNWGAAQAVALSGVGTTPAASPSPTSLYFSYQVTGTTSAAKTVTLSSTGTGPLQVTSVTASAPFSQTNNCTVPIAPGSSCTIQVSFTPLTTGSASGTLAITDNAGVQNVALTGIGIAPVTLSVNSLSFGMVVIGTTSAPKTVTVTNHQTVPLNFSSIGTSGAGFAIASNTCGTGIAAGGKCTVGVTFTPAAAGTATGTLTFTDSATNSPQVVSLSGAGVAPVTLSASALSFGGVIVGTTSAAKAVTLTNHQTVPLGFSSIGTSAAGFAIASNTCGTGIAAGAKCTVGVTFSPTATGTVNGTLKFVDSASNSPQTVTLSGTGK